ncbi:Electron transport complex, RnfABCDGE type, G subunit [Marinobacter sp. ELB17]|nr:FAD-binding protein [Marinobacter sp. ELB17]EAZ98560.1 Electron transport complex, RnfABCDGE type, G subunit [Marinobacter sp. ELB17]
MIPRLTDITPVQSLYLAFIDALKAAGFEGELNPDYANRTVLATDNSIYQVLPQAVVYPKHTADLQCVTTLTSKPEWRSIVLSPRGGGTGTNAQSLTEGIIVDLSRHMNRVLEINPNEGWARCPKLNRCLTGYDLAHIRDDKGLFNLNNILCGSEGTLGSLPRPD